MKAVVATLCLLLASAAVTRAEVGVTTGAGGGAGVDLANPLILGVTDDPEPTPLVWRVFRGTAHATFRVLNPNGESNGDGPPAILVDEAIGRRVVAAWARNSQTGFDIVVSRFESGEWTEPEVVAGTAVNERDPDLVRSADGSWSLFYWTDDGSTRQVLHVVAPPDLSSWSSPELVSQPGAVACRPHGVVHQGVLRVTYEVHDFGFGSSPRQVVLARREGSGFVQEVVAVTHNPGDVRPRVHSREGTMWVEWIDAVNGLGGEMAWTRLSPGGSWEPLRHEPFASTEERDYSVRGAIRLQAIQ